MHRYAYFGKKSRALCFLTVFFSVILLVSGCLNPTSVDEFGYVLTIGIDKGKQFKYNLSFMMQSANNEGGSTSTGKPTIVSAEGDSIFNAIYTAESGLPYRLNFARVNMMFVSQALAKSGAMNDLLAVSWSILKVQTSADIFVCAGEAVKFMEGLAMSESIEISKLENSLHEISKADGRTTTLTLSDFTSSILDPRYDAVAPYGDTDTSIKGEENKDGDAKKDDEKKDTTAGVFRQGGMKSYVNGSAVFDGAIMVGVISENETQLFLMSQGQLENAAITLKRSDGSMFVVRIGNMGAPKIDVNFGDSISITYDIMIIARLEMDTSQERIMKMREEGKFDDETEQILTEPLKAGVTKLFYDCKEMGADIFGIGKYVSRRFSTAEEWEKSGFEIKTADVEVTFNVSVEMENVYVSSYMD